MKSIQSKNITPNNSNHVPFFGKGSSDFFPGKKNKPFFNASPVQAKLTVNEPGDPFEKEADSMADKVVQRLNDKSFSGSENNQGHFFNKPRAFVQRKCASCDEEEKLQKKEEIDEKDLLKDKLQTKPIFESNAEPPPDDENIQRKCAECEQEEKLQKKPASDQIAPPGIEGSLNIFKGSGSPLPHNTREQMESSFGADFSGVKIHSDSASVQMNRDLNAQAFTHGSDIYFNSGKYNSNNKDGQHLLAHELTHVVQQAGGKNIQRQEEPVPDTNDVNTQGRFLTDDSATPGEGQMKKSDFLQRLNTEVCATVDEALQSTGSSSDNCPYIREVFARYQNNTPAQIEQVLQRYEPSTRFAGSADDLIQMVKAHAFTAAIQWAANGILPGLPENISSMISSGISTVSNAVSTVTNAISNVTSGISNAVSSIGNLFFKSKPGGNHATQSPLGVMQSLGKGSPISSSTKGRMESAFGTNFSNVQIHTDSKAAGLSNSMNARAFTVGNHIAFGSGEHKPGTLVGDALMAHELAHVEQQKGNGLIQKNSEKDFESDADESLLSSVKESGSLEKISPKLKSGLTISRCSKSKPATCSVGVKTITVDFIRMRGATPNPAGDLAAANTIYAPCCINFVKGKDETVPLNLSNTWLGGDADVNESGVTCSPPLPAEEKSMYDGATSQFNLSSRMRVFYVQSFSGYAALGFSRPQYCAAGYPNHVLLQNGTNTTDLAHEFGHILLNDSNDGGHTPGDKNNLMYPSNDRNTTIDSTQCNTMYNNA